jgi:hypothetical protein
MAANQLVTFLTDGGEDIRDLPCYLNPQAEHLLDWFHITMRITVMTNMAKSLQPPPPDPDPELSAETATKLIGGISEDLGRLKWFLWHGNVFNALATVESIAIDLETLHPDDQPSKLLKAVHEFDSYLHANAGRIPNYGERRRAGEAISTAFVESTVNQVISKRMVKNSRCAGHRAVPTCYCRYAPESSTTPSPTTTSAGIRLHPHLQSGHARRSAGGGIAPTECSALLNDRSFPGLQLARQCGSPGNGSTCPHQLRFGRRYLNRSKAEGRSQEAKERIKRLRDITVLAGIVPSSRGGVEQGQDGPRWEQLSPV